MKTPPYRGHQILEKLRRADLEIEKGISVPLICQKLDISEQTYFRWRKKYGRAIQKSGKQNTYKAKKDK